MPSRHAPIGLIVKTWNTGEVTRRCLDAIAGAVTLPSELAMLDLGDDPKTRSYAVDLTTRLGIRLHWLEIGRRLAPGEANRRGYEVLSAPLIGLLDNDVIVPPNWLGPVVSILRSPGIGLAAPVRPDPYLADPFRDDSSESILDAIKNRQTTIADIVEEFTLGRSLEEYGREVQRTNDLPRESAVTFPSSLSSCCLGLTREAVEAAGGIADAAFSDGYGSEDIDLSWRILRAGYQAIRTPEVFVLHLRHTSIAANQIDVASELVAANQILYSLWRKPLLSWARDRLRRGDSRDDLSQRFIIRELLRNTAFGSEVFPS